MMEIGKSQMERLRKGRRDVISQREGRERGGQRWTDGVKRGEGEEVSPRQGAVLSLGLLEPVSVLLLLLLDLSVNCY